MNGMRILIGKFVLIKFVINMQTADMVVPNLIIVRSQVWQTDFVQARVSLLFVVKPGPVWLLVRGSFALGRRDAKLVDFF